MINQSNIGIVLKETLGKFLIEGEVWGRGGGGGGVDGTVQR